MEWTGNQPRVDRPYQGGNNLRAGVAIAAVALFGWSGGWAQTASSPTPAAVGSVLAAGRFPRNFDRPMPVVRQHGTTGSLAVGAG